MNEVRGEIHDKSILISLSGRIDSGNAASVEKEINEYLAEAVGNANYAGYLLTIDMSDLEYISSAGLRILLRLKNSFNDLTLEGVGSDIYEILDMTGFTQIMNVQKTYSRVSVEGCEVIGQGANGTVYRIDGDNVVKVYKDANALEEIQHEREVARLALVLGLPTAISYDVVRVGDSYGSVFELLDAKSFSKILITQPEKMDWCVHEYVDLLRKIHTTVVPEGKLPDMRKTVIGWGRFVRDYLPEEAGRKLLRLITAVPKNRHMIHGDYHTNNIQLTGEEVLLIDMETLAVGDPIFELGSMFNAYVGFGEYDNSLPRRFLGLERPFAAEFWCKTLAAYLGTDDEARIQEVEDKARVIGYTRLIRRSIRRGGLETEEGRAEIELWKSHLLELIDRIDTLRFSAYEIKVTASVENLPGVIKFLNTHLDNWGSSLKVKSTIELAVEEIFVNIASYAYTPGTGDVTIRVGLEEADGEDAARTVAITFIDQGVPYDPLKREAPDVSLPASQRQIGGLGIFLVRKTMDDMSYEYRDNSNMLTIKKQI